jgi:hypothetical protein
MKRWLLVLLAAAVIGGSVLFYLNMKNGSDPVEERAEEVPALTTAPLSGEAGGPFEKRTVAAVINNHPDARPQTGLAEADMVFEFIAEYNITRFLALYQSEFPEEIGPVRSAREYFVKLAAAYDAFFIAHGYSPEAYQLLQSGIVDHVNGMDYDGTLFQRSTDRVAPHNSYIAYENVLAAMEKAGASAGYKGSSPYAFYDSIENVKLMEQASFVEVQYGTDPDFLNAYTYDAGTHLYSRATGGTPTVEKETGEAIELANLLVFEAEHKTIDAKGRQAIDIGSGGKALLFQGGGVQEIEWSSEDGMLVPTVDGETVQLAPGKSWIHIVPADPGMGSSVRYTP